MRARLGGILRKARRHSALVLGERLDGANPVGVLARVWAWQVWRRTVKRTAVIRCAEGTLLIAPSWSRVAPRVAGTGLTERDDALFVIDLLRRGDLFVDVGANIGFYTAVASRRGARVEAYEPTADAAEVCEQAVRRNGMQDLATVHRVAVGATPGSVRFTTGLDISNHILTPASAQDDGVEVELVTLDQELAGLQAPLTMLKVDAEGHDLDVLRGAAGSIERLRPVVLVEIWVGGSGPLALLERHGYAPYLNEPRARTLTEVDPNHRLGGNMLLISGANIEAVRDRVTAAERPPLRAPAIEWFPADA